MHNKKKCNPSKKIYSYSRYIGIQKNTTRTINYWLFNIRSGSKMFPDRKKITVNKMIVNYESLSSVPLSRCSAVSVSTPVDLSTTWWQTWLAACAMIWGSTIVIGQREDRGRGLFRSGRPLLYRHYSTPFSFVFVHYFAPVLLPCNSSHLVKWTLW